MHFSRRALLTGLLGLAAAPALAQGMGFGLGMQDVVVRAGGGGGAALDNFTTPSGAYSFRLLRKAYLGAGAAVRLKRASDLAESDIGFSGGNDFDTVSATAFCAATTCTVATWYDQSGLGLHLVQATAANQPVYVANCQGALPCMQTTVVTQQLLTAANVTPATGILSMSVVGMRVTGFVGTCGWIRQNGASANRITANTGAGSWVAAGASGTIATTAPQSIWHASSVVINGASSVANTDGVEVTGTITGSTAAGTQGIVGVGGTTTCNFGEAIVWDNYQLTGAERTALNNNQKNYWMPAPLDSFATPSGAYSFRKLKSTYSGPAVRLRRASDNAELDINFLGCTGFTGCPWDSVAAVGHCASTNCFLSKWYTQAGTLDLVQTTTASQPALIFNCNGTLPCARFTGASSMASVGSITPATGVVSFTAVGNRSSGTGQCGWIRENGLVNRLQGGAANTWSLAPTPLVGAATDAAWHAAAGNMSTVASASALNIDGVETTGTTAPTLAAGTVQTAGATTTNCDAGELALWDNYALTAGERATLVNNQRSFWGF